MKAAVIRELGAAPDVAEVDEPSGDVVEVLAAPINPIDLAVSAACSRRATPSCRTCPAARRVGRTADGRFVWIFGRRAGPARNGAMAEPVRRRRLAAIEVPDGCRPGAGRRARHRRPRRAGSRSRGGHRSAEARTSWCSARPARSGSSRCRRRSFSAPRASSRRAGARRASSAPRRWERMRPCVSTRRGPRHRVQGRLRRRRARATSSTRSGGPPAAAAVQAAVPWATIVNLGQSAGATVGARLGRGALQEPRHPRSHELRRARGPARRPLPPSRRARGRRGDPARGRAGAARRRRRRLARQAEGAGTKLVLVP